MRDGWTETTLGEVVDIQKGKKPPELDVFVPLSKPYLTADVLRGASCEQFVANALVGSCVHLSGHETILLWDGAGAGDVFKSQPGILASTMAKVQSKNFSAIVDGYLYLYLDSKRFEIKSSCRGTTVPHVSPEALKSLTFSLPPLVEQKRIVDVVSSVDSYIDALQQQADTARTARNAVLHELLSAGGEDWTESTLGELCDVRDGTHDSPKQSEAGYPLVTSKNIRNGKVDLSDVYLISDSDFQEINKRSKVDRYDLLISMIGTVGEVCFEPNQPNYAIKNVGLIKTGSELLGRFLLGYLSSGIGQKQIELSTSGSTQKFIGLGKLRSLSVCLPPFTEQKRIVEIVSCMDDFIQGTEQAVMNAKNLRSGLLSDLLSGEHEIPASYDSLLGAA